MFLVALIMSLGMPVMAQNATDLLKIKGLKPYLDGETMYYIKNVGTGLTLSYGGEWGTHCIETQTAHPVILEDNGDGTVSIGSLLGYLDSHTLWMDFHKHRPTDEALKAENTDPNIYSYWEVGATVSNWTLVSAKDDGYEGQYYIVGENNRYLSSVGNRAGLLALKYFEDKAYQRWVFVDGDYIRDNYMPSASIDNPIDVSLAFRGGSFDLVDDHAAKSSTPEFFKNRLPYMDQYWKNYSEYATWGYDRCVRTSNSEEYNCCNMLYKVVTTAPVQYQLTLPMGAYKFTFEGFYKHKSTNNETYLRIDGLSDDVKIDIKQNPSVSYKDNNTAGSIIFRDNDDYLMSTNFYLTNTTTLLFSISREQTWEGKDEMIYLDNFRLYYAGCIDQNVDPMTIYPLSQEATGTNIVGTRSMTIMRIWNVETGSYDVYTASRYNSGAYEEICQSNGWEMVSEDDINFVSQDDYESIKAANNQKAQAYKEYYNANKNVIESYANAADDDNIFKNYILANKADYLSKMGAVAQDVFNEHFTVDVSKINSREKYYDAIAKLEEAWALAVIADGKNEGGKNSIANPSFEEGVELQDIDEKNNKLYAPKHWTVGGFSSDTQVIMKAGGHNTYKTEGMDGDCLFNTWWQGTPLTQEVTELANGTYLLSALIASGDPGNDATIYLTAKDGETLYKRGVNPPSGGKVFGDYTKKCIVSNGKLTVGIVGGADDDTPEQPIGSYTATGHWWYKCDNFRLEYLEDGVLKFQDKAISIYNLIDDFVNVQVERTIKSNSWSSFVVPFAMKVPNGWEVREFDGASVRTVDGGDNITLKFRELDTEKEEMKAGKPYMVRLSETTDRVMAKNATQRDGDVVGVNTTLFVESSKDGISGVNEFTSYDVEFIGVYTSGKIPKSEIDENGNPVGPQYYFISNNTLYRSVGSDNTIKGFRGYFKVTPTGALSTSALRSLSMEMGDETIVGAVDAEDVTVVAIYDIKGVRLEATQPGINILRMSDGTTKKVLVK